ncbi:hypothetical protein KR059_011614, partial [Drosophila kikkawai]
MLNSLSLRALLRCKGVRSPLNPSFAGQNVALGIIRRHESSCLTLKNSFKCYNLEEGPSLDVELSRDDALEMYTQMVEARRFETMAGNYYKSRLIRGFCHLYNGQEAVAVGMKARLRKQDSVITAYRCHVWSYVMGVSLYEMMSELLGFRPGCSRGKGGSMHMYCDNFYGGNGIVGAQVPVGTGVALAHSYRNDGGVCISLYGDGAANQGQVFESFNMAKLWCLPVVFVCENNQYGMGTKAERSSAMTDYYKRGQYIPGLWVDGNQVLAVRTATEFAVDYALEHGPIVLEMNTYRYVGHSMSDPGISYRSREEVQTARETNDPITSFRKQILDLCLMSEKELKELDVNIKKYVDGECKKALTGKEVELQELHADVSSKNLEPKIRGVSGYNLDHVKLADVCFGKPKKTPACEINDVPVGDAVLAAKVKEDKEKVSKNKPVSKDGKPGKVDQPGKEVKIGKDAKPVKEVKAQQKNTSDGKKNEASSKQGKPPPVTNA